MNKPTVVSVTTIPCECGYLVSSARNPDLPVQFDKEMNEYSVVHKLESGAIVSMALYHCPMCGGCAPESKRSTFFHPVSDDELRRLNLLIEKVGTVADIQIVIGKPDLDETMDAADVGNGRSTLPVQKPVRVLSFTRLSKVAEIKFLVYADGTLDKIVGPKYLGSGG